MDRGHWDRMGRWDCSVLMRSGCLVSLPRRIVLVWWIDVVVDSLTAAVLVLEIDVVSLRTVLAEHSMKFM